MDVKIIIILVLLVLSYFQYAQPEKTNKIIDPLYSKVKTFIAEKTGKQITNNTDNDGCTAESNPVCGSNGVTYQNICKASLANVGSVTPGECQ